MSAPSPWASPCWTASTPMCTRPARRSTTKSAATLKHLVKTGEDISRQYGIPIINKRISVTPIAMICRGLPHRLPRPFRQGSGQGRPHRGGQLHRRVLRPGAQGLWPRGLRPDREHPPGLGRDRAGVLLCQRGHHQGGHQHGRRGEDGPHRQGDRPAHRRPGVHRRGQAGGVLQRPRGQPLYGGRLPRPRRAGLRHQRGRLRPRRGAGRHQKARRGQQPHRDCRADQAHGL